MHIYPSFNAISQCGLLGLVAVTTTSICLSSTLDSPFWPHPPLSSFRILPQLGYKVCTEPSIALIKSIASCLYLTQPFLYDSSHWMFPRCSLLVEKKFACRCILSVHQSYFILQLTVEDFMRGFMCRWSVRFRLTAHRSLRPRGFCTSHPIGRGLVGGWHGIRTHAPSSAILYLLPASPDCLFQVGWMGFACRPQWVTAFRLSRRSCAQFWACV